MAYDGTERKANELHALSVLQLVLKGKGAHSAVFYAAGAAGESSSLVAERVVRDRTGTKTLEAGKKMRKALGGDLSARGVVEWGEGGNVEVLALEVRGSLAALKKALCEDLATRGATAKEENPAADRLAKLLRRATFAERGSEEILAPTESSGSVEETALTPEELKELGLADGDVAELTLLGELIESRGDRIAQALGEALVTPSEVGASEELDDDEAVARSLEALNTEFGLLRERLGSFEGSHLPEDERLRLREEVDRVLRGIAAFLGEGEKPFPTVGELVDAGTALLLDVLKSQGTWLETTRGKRTAGLECEYSRSPVRVEGTSLPDHTVLFVLKAREGGERLADFCFETQGSGRKGRGTLEAITVPFDADTVEGKQRLAWMASGIEAMYELLAGQRGKAVRPGDVTKHFDQEQPSLQLEVTPGLPESLALWPTLESPVRKSPQVNVTHALGTLNRTFAEGFPEGVSSAGTVNTEMMQDAAADASELFDALLKQAGISPSEQIGDRLLGFLTLVVQDAQRVALEHVYDTPDDSGWAAGSFTRRDPPGGTATRRWHWAKDRYPLLPKTPLAVLAQDGGLSPEELALLRDPRVKTALFDGLDEILARQGVDQETQLPLGVDAPIEPGESRKSYGGSLTLRTLLDFAIGEDMPPKPPPEPPRPGKEPPKPGKEPERPSEVEPRDPGEEPWRPALARWPGTEPPVEQREAHQRWEENTRDWGLAQAHDRWQEEAGLRQTWVYRKKVHDAWREATELRTRWEELEGPHAEWRDRTDVKAYARWRRTAEAHWGWMLGDSGVHVIEQRDGEQLRVATEYRMLSGEPPIQTTSDRILDGLVRVEDELRRERAVRVLDL